MQITKRMTPLVSKGLPGIGLARGNLAATAALVLSCVIWGSAFAFGKLALRELTVAQLVLLRFGLASLTLLPLIIYQKAWVQRSDLPSFLLAGFLAVPVTFLLQFHGLALTTISRASLIIGAIPPLLALGAALYLGENPGPRGWAAIGISMLGVLVITGSPGGGGSWTGDGLVFLSTLISVIWVIMNKRLSERYGALAATTYLLLFGTVSLVPITLITDGLPSFALPLAVWISVFILGIFCTALAFVLWNWGLEQFPASTAGIYLNLEPLVGAMLGISLWGEKPGAGVILGGGLIIGAALLATMRVRKFEHA